FNLPPQIGCAGELTSPSSRFGMRFPSRLYRHRLGVVRQIDAATGAPTGQLRELAPYSPHIWRARPWQVVHPPWRSIPLVRPTLFWIVFLGCGWPHTPVQVLRPGLGGAVPPRSSATAAIPSAESSSCPHACFGLPLHLHRRDGPRAPPVWLRR